MNFKCVSAPESMTALVKNCPTFMDFVGYASCEVES